MTPPNLPNDRETLRQHFNQIAPDQQVNGWNEMWRKKVTPWDRGTPNPALADTLEAHSQYFGGRGKKRALVPGCGRGYDVFLLTAHGYDAFGLDSSPLAIESAQALVGAEGHGEEQRYPLHKGVESRGQATFVKGDFFADEFLAETDGGGTFDLIYDYTFLCALPPALRPKWAKRMSELLAEDGCLVCVEFPLQKEPRMGGPPHGLTKELYEELLGRPGRDVGYDEGGYVTPDRSGGGVAEGALERVERWTAERTHAAGQGSDCVSIWRHLRR